MRVLPVVGGCQHSLTILYTMLKGMLRQFHGKEHSVDNLPKRLKRPANEYPPKMVLLLLSSKANCVFKVGISCSIII